MQRVHFFVRDLSDGSGGPARSGYLHSMSQRDSDTENDDQDAEPSLNAPDDGRPDGVSAQANADGADEDVEKDE